MTSARRVLSGNVTNTRAFRKGRLVIQDEASQLVALLVGQGKTILDCCAAPGGKTRIMASRNPDATVLAAELRFHRARLLGKLASERNVRIITADARELPLNIPFDRVLADVPCSGTGTLVHNPEIKWRLTPEDLKDFHSRQAAILKSVMRLVAAGGRLIYSTCSLEREENEAVVEEALSENRRFARSTAGQSCENYGRLANSHGKIRTRSAAAHTCGRFPECILVTGSLRRCWSVLSIIRKLCVPCL